MVPPRGQLIAQNFQRELAEVQTYIQARVPTDEPYLFHVNPAHMAEYQDELQDYVRQKQQLRRPLPTSRTVPSQAKTAKSSNVPAPMPKLATTHSSASDRHVILLPSERRSETVRSVVPKRLPGVEWLLANRRTQPLGNRHDDSRRWEECPPAPSIPSVPAMPLPRGHGFASYPPLQHHTLKKQKTM